MEVEDDVLVCRCGSRTCAKLGEVVVDGNDVIVEVEDDAFVCRCGGSRKCTCVPKQGSIVASTTGIALLTLLPAMGVAGVTWRLKRW